MITTEEKKQIVAALSEALDREGLLKKEAAWYLNLHPNYITWALNEKYWDTIREKWNRLQEWQKSRDKISDFKLPDGEVYNTEKPSKRTIEKGSAADKIRPASEQSPAAVINNDPEKNSVDNARIVLTREPKIAKKKGGKEVTHFEYSDNTSDLEDLRQQIKLLEDNSNTILNLKKQQDAIVKSTASISDMVSKILMLFDKPAKKKPTRSIVIFQRNIYQK